jgi:hypothetical protein
MATTWDKFYPHVQPYVPGCPEIVIETHLQEAASEFCAKSEVWRFTLDADFTSKNTSDYELDVPTGSILESMLFFYLDGVPMTHVSERHFYPGINDDGSAIKGTPLYFSTLDDASIRMYPTPEGKHVFTGVGVLKTKLSATGVEDFIFESHGRSISAGAIARIAGIPGKEWSDPDVSMRSQVEFERAMCAAKGRDTRRINMRVSPVNF